MQKQRENIYERKDGRWEGRYIKGRIDGKIQYGYVFGKSGGAYVTVTGIAKRLDDVQRLMVLTDGTVIPVNDILDLESDLFRGLE